MNDNQLERYSRHIILEKVGKVGQQKILNSKILIIGAGGLGSPAALYLAAAGVGTIGLVDYDIVDLSNLQRQIIHQTKDIGRAKIDSGREKIEAINPDVDVKIYNELTDSKNIVDIVKDADYDFILDCTDNFETKFLINDTCVLMKKPFSHAGIIRFQGQTMTYVPNLKEKFPCYRCIFPKMPPKNSIQKCSRDGLLGVVPGVIGTIQATEALKYILGIGELLTGFLLTYDALSMNFRKIKIKCNKNCPVCGEKDDIDNRVTI